MTATGNYSMYYNRLFSYGTLWSNHITIQNAANGWLAG
jgi:hypothetical protein